MAPKNKAKAAGVSASSFFDLKAELSKKEDEFSRAKAAGKSGTGLLGGEKKKPTVWARQNKGVNARAARDVELEAVSRPTLESARAALERKAKIYDKLKKGKSGGLSEQQYDALLVDFDQKEVDAYETDSDDADESAAVPKAPGLDDPVVEYEDEFGRMRTAPKSQIPSYLAADGEDDPIVEYEDEFGRVRQARRSEVPREFQRKEPAIPEDDPDVLYNPTHHFPVYEPDAARVSAINLELAEAQKPLGVHYDGAAEVRAKGAGFYQFSGDEEARRRQMAELAAARAETSRARAEGGAVDVRPGEVEGFGEGEGAPEGAGAGTGGNGVVGDVGASKSRAMEKRKRELEERRKALDAKRRKTKGAGEESVQKREEREITPRPQPASIVSTEAASVDPFASVEIQATSKKGKGKAREAAMSASSADDFLSQLERDLLKR